MKRVAFGAAIAFVLVGPFIAAPGRPLVPIVHLIAAWIVYRYVRAESVALMDGKDPFVVPALLMLLLGPFIYSVLYVTL